MKALLVRVGADLTVGGGRWNGPVDRRTGRFVYVPIPETKPVHPGLEKPYAAIVPALRSLNAVLPRHLADLRMHLDPDFDHLTYGDRGAKGRQLATTLLPGDLLLFYAGLRDVVSRDLVYGLIGAIVVDRVALAVEQAPANAKANAHTRRILSAESDDVIVIGNPRGSGRLSRFLPIGEYRSRAYRVRKDLIDAWGGLSVNDGYLQRSAVFPSLLEPEKFLGWWARERPKVLRLNNP